MLFTFVQVMLKINPLPKIARAIYFTHYAESLDAEWLDAH
jgi:hypothetical protein